MRIFAIFDCCSTPLSNYKALLEVVGRGEEDGDGEFADPNEISIEVCQYVHLSPARPAGIAAADAGNAQRVFDWMDRFAQKPPAGFVNIPADIFRIPGGNVSAHGGEDYEIPFQF